MACPHPLEASGAAAVVPGMPKSLTMCHCAEVGPPPDQAPLRDGVIYCHGLWHHLFRGLYVGTPEAARRGLDQVVQVQDLGVVVCDTDLGCLEPPDPGNLDVGPSGLLLCFTVGHVQHGVKKSADALGVHAPGNMEPLSQKPPASP